MSKKSKKKRGQHGHVPWWQKHGLPPIFGTMLDAMSKDDSAAMAAAVRAFYGQNPFTDLFDPAAGGFQVPMEALGLAPQAFGFPPGSTLLASFWVACSALNAWDCFLMATTLSLRCGHVGGVHSSYASMAHMLARYAPTDKKYQNLHEALTNLTRSLARIRDHADPTWAPVLDDVFEGEAAEPFWAEAKMAILAEREDAEIYKAAEGGGSETRDPPRAKGGAL